MELVLVCLYLLAIIAANWSVATFGVQFAVVNSFVFIAFDLTSRDALHLRWRHKGLPLRMFALIAAGSLLSYALAGVREVALASFVAFAIAGIADTLVFAFLHQRSRLVRMNASNVVSAVIDSLLFQWVLVLLAFFPAISWEVFAVQVVAKIAGGLVWSYMLTKGDRAQLSIHTP